MDRFTAWVRRQVTGALRRRLLRAARAGFGVSVSGVVRDGEGRVLLLRRRRLAACSRWGLPGGRARAGETFRHALVRTVREDAGLAVIPGRLVAVRRVRGPGARFVYGAVRTAGEPRPGPGGVLEAAWFTPGILPAGLPGCDRVLIRAGLTPPDLGCNKTIKKVATTLAQDRVMTRSCGPRGWR